MQGSRANDDDEDVVESKVVSLKQSVTLGAVLRRQISLKQYSVTIINYALFSLW